MSFKLWLKIIDGDKVACDTIFEGEGSFSEESYFNALKEGVRILELSTPVTLKTHYLELAEFNRTQYLPRDFIETAELTSLDVECIAEELL